MKIAATVIMYNSDEFILENIYTYYSQVERIYVIDNSEMKPAYLVSLFEKLDNIQYIYNNGNKGVAAALNIAAALAISEGFDHLLTMDDDSRAPPDMIIEMLKYIKQSNEKENIGIVSAVHSSRVYFAPYKAVPYTMTSGNLLNLSIYERLGPFREDFFIDHVDHEYGFRLNKAGFWVIELSNIKLQHQLGEYKSIGFGKRHFISHSPIRGYYIVRNGLVLAKQYPAFYCQLTILIVKEWIKAAFFEDCKGERIKFMWKGAVDAWYNRLGKFNE